MKKVLFFLLCILTLFSCDDDKKEDIIKKDVLTLSDTEFDVDAKGQELKLTITSNVSWVISDLPDWCKADTLKGGQGADVVVDEVVFKIDANNIYEERSAVLKISGGNIETKLPITQAGLEKGKLSLYGFPVNTFDYDGTNLLTGSNGDLNITIEATELFINNPIIDKVYLGSIIGGSPMGCAEIKEFNNYTYINPVDVISSVYSIEFERWTNPTKAQLDQYASKVVESKPKQQVSFRGGSPLNFYSHRELAAWSLSNLGLDFPKMISGSSYQEKEMVKGAGLLYTYSQVAFNVVMDVEYADDGRLMKEDLDEAFAKDNDLHYIDMVNYGRTAYMIVESDYNINTVRILVNRVLRGEALTDAEMDIINDCDVYYLYHTKGNKIEVKGYNNLETIKAYNESSSINDIIPLSFTVRSLYEDGSGSIKYKLTLPK